MKISLFLLLLLLPSPLFDVVFLFAFLCITYLFFFFFFSSPLYASVKLASRESSFLYFICPWALSLLSTTHSLFHHSIYVSGQVNQLHSLRLISLLLFVFTLLVLLAAAAVATLFMSHIRNAYSKRSNFLHQCFKHTLKCTSIRVCVCINMVVFSFN